MPLWLESIVTFASPAEANRFLLERLRAQAAVEGVVFSPSEEHTLISPDCDHSIEEEEAIELALEKDSAFEAVLKKVTPLLRSAYQRDAAMDPRMSQAYRSAYDRLSRHGGYVLGLVYPGGRFRTALNSVFCLFSPPVFRSKTWSEWFRSLLAPSTLYPLAVPIGGLCLLFLLAKACT